MALFGKKNSPQPPPPSEAPPTVSEADLAKASQLMDRWDAAMGNSDAIWACMETIAHQGGWKGEDVTMREAMEASRGGDAASVTQRPWRWWNEAAIVAQATGHDVLAGRIFLFAHMFVQQLAPKMDWRNMASVGLDPPADDTYKSIAASAVGALAKLDPSFLIHNTATGQVDVAGALSMAEQVSGVIAPRGQMPSAPPHASPGPSDETSPFNSL